MVEAVGDVPFLDDRTTRSRGTTMSSTIVDRADCGQTVLNLAP